jgi:hypothetical protein
MPGADPIFSVISVFTNPGATAFFLGLSPPSFAPPLYATTAGSTRITA